MSTFDPAACAELIEAMTATSLAAADAIRRLHGQGGVRIKADGSPVTAADEAAEAVIHDGLAHLAPALPVISEEQAERAKPSITSASIILVDPLDTSPAATNTRSISRWFPMARPFLASLPRRPLA